MQVAAKRVALATLPTPLEFLPRLSRTLGGPDIWVKRDDCTGLGMGGNKARKLEYLIGDARAKGADTLITAGALQSNHARQTAAAAAKLGLGCILVLTDTVPERSEAYRSSGNVLLDRLFGADVRMYPRGTDAAAVMETVAKDCREAGRKPYVIPIGGSNEIGALGYVDASHELAQQGKQLGLCLSCVVTASGSAGTQAGLVAGFSLRPNAPRVIGFSVARKSTDQSERVRSIADTTTLLCGGSLVSVDSVVVDDNFIGDGYGRPTKEMTEAVRLVAQEEGLILDPVYSGKAMAGLIAYIRAGRFTRSDQVTFIHTGGSVGLFAYDDVFGGSSPT
jgi:D-cysteine desulfhydrase family pyridoxal phosphate-dependent enzyme